MLIFSVSDKLDSIQHLLISKILGFKVKTSSSIMHSILNVSKIKFESKLAADILQKPIHPV